MHVYFVKAEGHVLTGNEKFKIARSFLSSLL